jgi:hypothetical protein
MRRIIGRPSSRSRSTTAGAWSTSLAASLRIAPRGGIAWSPFADQRTVLRAGYGLFYDHLPLDIYTFGRYPLRTITNYSPDGSIIDSPIPFANVIGSVTGPRSFFINGQQVAGAFRLAEPL